MGGVKVGAGSKPSYDEKMRVPPGDKTPGPHWTDTHVRLKIDITSTL